MATEIRWNKNNALCHYYAVLVAISYKARFPLPELTARVKTAQIDG